MNSFKQRMYVGLIAGLDEIYKKYFGNKNPGKQMALLFKGNWKDAEKYVRYYHQSDPNAEKKYILKRTNPELERQVKAWLSKQ